MQCIVAQLGARMHYAVPKIFHAQGRLRKLVTDFHLPALASHPWLATPLANLPLSRRALGRNANLPPALVKSCPGIGAEWAARRRLFRKRSQLLETKALIAGKLNTVAIHQLKKTDSACLTYSFNQAGMELIEFAGKNGHSSFVEQTIVPLKIELQLLKEFTLSGPTYDRRFHEVAQKIIDREAREWESADLIICGSEFVMKGIGLAGGPTEKCRVVPYGVQIAKRPVIRDFDGSRPLRVLTVGPRFQAKRI